MTAKYQVTSPRGETFEVTAPDDATQEQVLAYAQSQGGVKKESPQQKSQSFVETLGRTVLETLPTVGLKRGIDRSDRFLSVTGLDAPLKAVQQGVFGGVADLMGAPVDIANAITGGDLPGGSQTMRRGMNVIPLPSGQKLTNQSIQDVPKDMRPFVRGGEVIGGSLPIAAAPFMVKRGLTELPKAIRPIIQLAREAPKTFLGIEAGATFGASQGAAVAELLFPDSPVARFVGEMGGALLNPIGLALRGIQRGIQDATRAVKSLTRAGRVSSASETVQQALLEAGEDLPKLQKILREIDLPGLELTSGQKTGSPTLLAMESAISAKSPKFGGVAKLKAERGFEALRKLIGQMEATGDPEMLKVAARVRQTYFENLMTSRLAVAQNDLNKTLTAFQGDKQVASTKGAKILDDALHDARNTETGLWNDVPKDVTIQAEGTIAAHSKIRAEMLPEEPLPPSFIEDFVKRISKVKKPPESPLILPEGVALPKAEAALPDVTSGDLLRFRSKALELGREARAAGKFGEARQYSEMADGAMVDLEKLDIPEADVARAWSKSLNDIFSRTFAGDALAVNRAGAKRIPPEVMLERAFGGGGTTADLKFKQLQEAAAFSGSKVGMLSEQEEFLRAAAQATLDPQSGRVNPKQLEGFLRKNEDLLQRFPQVKRQLSDAASAEIAFQETEVATKTVSKIAHTRTAFSRVLANESPSVAVRNALASTNPTGDYMKLVKLARSGGGQAVKGLKAATIDHAVIRATDTAGVFSFEKFQSVFNKSVVPRGPTLLQMMKGQGVMSGSEAANLMTITKRALDIERALKTGTRLDTLVQDPNAMFDLVVRIVGANIGGHSVLARTSGAGIVVAGAGSRFARKIFEKIPQTRTVHVLQEAAENPKFMAALMEKPKTLARTRVLYQQINAAVIQAGLTQDERQQRIEQIPQ